MASRVAALLLLGVICLGFVTAEVPVDCCLQTSSKRFPLHIVAHHMIQEAGQGCEIGATVIITKVGKQLCFSHPSVEPWVQNYIRHLEKTKPNNQK
ncbi:C-C motif chemokine 19-like [Cheilinus undulatus]|uniref:C-C motif chemokine 19-like n=1 Tax=Cheilinus undulatus TaxID=241271 RepID=UPI001BD303E3|nr:C-C motif chemokine 19-like [Cheilinus undulatus]